MSIRITAISLIALASACLPAGAAAKTPSWTLSAEVSGVRVEGTPLTWSEDEIRLLARDGRLLTFHPSAAASTRKVSATFQGYSAAEMRAALTREFGRQLEITGTGHYLVAHPPGKGGQWAGRFEDMYRSFVHYFKVRGLSVAEPQFPLVAIVWNRHDDFLRYATAEGLPPSSGLLGYYSTESNRVTLYDVGNGKGGKDDWRQNADTIIHEATHQTAFNTGVHNRYGLPPRWLAEGLGTLFEAPGVHDSLRHTYISDRINRGRLKQFQAYRKAGRREATWIDLVNSDRLFQQNTDLAYAESWALTLYLVETRPAKFSEYLRRTAARPNFEVYPAARRWADFTASFGTNPRMFDAQFLQFIDGLK